MKQRLISGFITIILGALVTFGPQSIFPVCGVHTAQHSTEGSGEQTSMAKTMDKVMVCHWTARAELGIGVLIAAAGVLLIIIKSRQIRLGLSLALVLNGVLALLIPTVLIGVCGGAHMTCRALALPALIVISSVVIASAAANAVYLYKTNQEG